MSARRGEISGALGALDRLPSDPLTWSTRGHLLAKALRAFLTGATMPGSLPDGDLRFLGVRWPEFSAFLDAVAVRASPGLLPASA